MKITALCLSLGLGVLLAGCTVETNPPPAAPGQPVVSTGQPAGSWEKLGESNVGGKVDHDTITVGRSEGLFRAIQIKVENSALEMYDVVVTFADGTTYSPPTKLVFKPGETTRALDLPGNARAIRKVEFRYGNLPGGGNAKVELWGRT